ncbi:MAG: type II toxin-antitoxin system VapC family toxin [Caulobacter sp.]|nr:type II toxin-antitoxin system VapC family toxin [Caulobacter sp.]
MTSVVLDASAFIALLADEPGADAVSAVIAEAAMCTVNLCEVVAYAAKRGATQEDARQLIDPSPFARIPFDDDLAFRAGLMLPVTKSAGLSLGDRACIALAIRLKAPAMTTDRSWTKIAAAVGVEVHLIR